MPDLSTGQDVDIVSELPAGTQTIGKIDLNPIGSIGNGKKTVTAAGTAEALAGSTAIKSVTIKALSTNTGNVYVGDSGVDSTNGFQLAKGDTVSLDIDDLADVYIDVTQAQRVLHTFT